MPLTVYVLYSSDVVVVQREVVRVNVLVERRHDGTGVVRVLQAEGVAELVDGNQEEVYACQTDTHAEFMNGSHNNT